MVRCRMVAMMMRLLQSQAQFQQRVRRQVRHQVHPRVHHQVLVFRRLVPIAYRIMALQQVVLIQTVLLQLENVKQTVLLVIVKSVMVKKDVFHRVVPVILAAFKVRVFIHHVINVVLLILIVVSV